MLLATQGSTTSTTGGYRTTGIYYLDKASFPGTVGNIVVNFSRSIFTSNGYHIGAFALSGTATGFDAGSSNIGTGNNGTSATITVAQAGSFVAAVNSYGNLSAPTGMTEISGADTLNRAYQINVPAGSYTANFGGGNVTSLVSFAVPEPSTALLGGLGMLLLLRRRR